MLSSVWNTDCLHHGMAKEGGCSEGRSGLFLDKQVADVGRSAFYLIQLVQKFQLVQNAATRLTTGVGHRDHTIHTGSQLVS